MRVDYNTGHDGIVEVKGIRCEFFDMRLIPESVPEGKFRYEVAGDDESGFDPCRVQKGVMVNFFGTIITDQEFPAEEFDSYGTMWLGDDDWKWVE